GPASNGSSRGGIRSAPISVAPGGPRSSVVESAGQWKPPSATDDAASQFSSPFLGELFRSAARERCVGKGRRRGSARLPTHRYAMCEGITERCARRHVLVQYQ